MSELRAWHRLRRETAIEPELPIVDAHHHLWHRPPERYQLDELLADLNSGHAVRATCFVECGAMYRADGPEVLRPVGETEYVNGMAAASASGTYGDVRVGAAISGYADLRLEGVRGVLQAHVMAGGSRFRGIRQQAQHDPVLGSLARRQVGAGLLADPAFRRGFAELRPLGLVFEVFVFFTQLQEVADLARAFPDTSIVLNHLGGPLGIGPYADNRDGHFATWLRGMAAVADCGNVFVKIGGLGMAACGFGFERQATPPGSDALAAAWRPYVAAALDLFGSARCTFESNFPVDAQSCDYVSLWNAFKLLTANAAQADREALFSGTAERLYRLALPLHREGMERQTA
ncbi:MAG: amidohydrolase family protein [Rhodospirillales bacterium]